MRRRSGHAVLVGVFVRQNCDWGDGATPAYYRQASGLCQKCSEAGWGMLILILLVLLIGGGVAFYLKKKKDKQKVAAC